jgi:hypothetical protein
MGSRAVVIICRDEDAARKTFGVTGEGIGICYTRTGRRFFDNAALETEFLERVRSAATAAGFWDEFKTDWLCLDCELMPWSAKAQELLKQQYAAVGASAHAALADEVAVLEQAATRGLDVSELLARATTRRQMVNDYVAAYRHYCWPVDSVSDLKLAPFHLLASEGKVHADKSHDWHMQTLARLAGGIIIATPFHIIDVTNPDSEAEGIRWWEELTGRGGEGDDGNSVGWTAADGLLGGAVVILTILVFISAGVRTSLDARDMFTKLCSAGLTAFFGFQAMVNMGGITRALPMTGITLPFVSHGGFSLITSFAMLGMLMAFSHRNARDKMLYKPPRPASVMEAVK